jgi:hypothetical protein
MFKIDWTTKRWYNHSMKSMPAKLGRRAFVDKEIIIQALAEYFRNMENTDVVYLFGSFAKNSKFQYT